MSDLFLSWLGSLLFSQSGVFFFLCLYSCLFFLPGLQRPSTYKRLTRCWSFHAVWWWTLCTSAVQWRDEDFIWFKSFNSKPNQANYYNASVALRFELWKKQGAGFGPRTCYIQSSEQVEKYKKLSWMMKILWMKLNFIELLAILQLITIRNSSDGNNIKPWAIKSLVKL